MIIFDLDGTLADCEHRRHFVDVYKNPSYEFVPKNNELDWKEGYYCNLTSTPYFGKPWKPDWKSFYEACDQDKPIEAVVSTMRRLSQHENVQIWSGRCESVRQKTIEWFDKYISCFAPKSWFRDNLKMRPIGDSTPDDQLKERWLDEAIAEGKTIDFVFDDRPKVIRMWRRRGIFVFNCCQHDEEF